MYFYKKDKDKRVDGIGHCISILNENNDISKHKMDEIDYFKFPENQFADLNDHQKLNLLHDLKEIIYSSSILLSMDILDYLLIKEHNLTNYTDKILILIERILEIHMDQEIKQMITDYLFYLFCDTDVYNINMPTVIYLLMKTFDYQSIHAIKFLSALNFYIEKDCFINNPKITINSICFGIKILRKSNIDIIKNSTFFNNILYNLQDIILYIGNDFIGFNDIFEVSFNNFSKLNILFSDFHFEIEFINIVFSSMNMIDHGINLIKYILGQNLDLIEQYASVFQSCFTNHHYSRYFMKMCIANFEYLYDFFP